MPSAHQENYRNVLPSFEEKTAYGMKTQDPYSRLFRDRIVFLTSPIDGVSSNDIMSQLLLLEHVEPGSPITLYINSPGGSFEEMTAVYDTMDYITSPVRTICLGKAIGTAAVLLAAGEKGYRLALPNSKVVLHQPSGFSTGRDQASDITISANELVRTREWLETKLSALTGQDISRIKVDTEREYHLTAEKAVEYGLVDTVVSRPGR